MKKIILLVLAIIVGIALIYNNWKHTAQQEHQALPAPSQLEKQSSPEEIEEPTVRFPITEVQPEVDEQNPGLAIEQVKLLPPLDKSDDEIENSLANIIGHETLIKFFNVKNVIRHFVVTVDNLPRTEYAVKYLPTKPVAGRFLVTGKEDNAVISTDNYQRYIPYIELAESLDVKAVVSIYTGLYPLFQEAYKNLGYPMVYFNDRLIEVIDHLLNTPDIKGPIKLVQPNVLYEYADEELEALSAGQKILIRMGNDNAHRIKAILRTFRNELTAGEQLVE